jgi:5-methylcytosine-specific restriction endonuclease McrA
MSKPEFIACTCIACKESFLSIRRKRICSNACRRFWSQQNQNNQRYRKHTERALVVQCAACLGEYCPLFLQGRVPMFCYVCDPTADINHWSAVRRRRIQSAYIEKVDRIKVFERDGWRCRICGGKTIAQAFKSNSAELDHIRSLADGGEHSYRNTQCACRRCNTTKGSKSLGQMLLLG